MAILKNKENLAASRADEIITLTKSLETPDNPVLKEFERRIFNEVLSQDKLEEIKNDETKQEELIKGLLSKVLKDHILKEFDNDAETAVDHLTDKDDRFEPTSPSNPNPAPTGPAAQPASPTISVKNLDEYVDEILNITEYTDSSGKNHPIWLHPNIFNGNAALESKQIDLTDLYKPEALSDTETSTVGQLIFNYLPQNLEYKDPKDKSKTKKVDSFINFKQYLGINPPFKFDSKKSITTLKNSKVFIDAFRKLEKEYNDNPDQFKDSEKQVIQKFRNLLTETLNPILAQQIYKKVISISGIRTSLQNLTKGDIRTLSVHDQALLFTSKNDMKSLSDLSDSDFDLQFKALQTLITELYETDKSKEVSYLYEQFVTFENQKIKGVSFIQEDTQSRVADILTIVDEAPEFGINPSQLKQIETEASQYPIALKHNFRNSFLRDKEQMKKLRESRLNLAKLRAYNAALDLNLTNEELAKPEVANKIKEEVFLKAISTDLDDIFQTYQSYQEESKFKSSLDWTRKSYNKITNWYGKKIAAGGVFAGLGISFGARYLAKAGGVLAGGPMAGVALGALFLKPAVRRGLNQRSLNLPDDNDKIYNELALNFSEATRNMTGNRNDSIFSDSDDIQNEYIKKQQATIKKFEVSVSQKADESIKADKSIESKQNLLKVAIQTNKDPESINQLALELKKEITKKITEIYIQEYKKVLVEMEEKRKDYAGRFLIESATAFGAALGVSYVTGAVLDHYGWTEPFVSDAEASEGGESGESASSDSDKSGGENSDKPAEKESNKSNDSKSSNNSSDKDGTNPFDNVETGEDAAPSSETENSDKTDSKDTSQSKDNSKVDTNSTPQTEKTQTSLLGKLKDGVSDITNFFIEPTAADIKEIPEGAKLLVVPNDIELKLTSDKDPGLVQIIRALTDNRISVKDALSVAKQLDLKDVDLIEDGQHIIFSKELVEEIAEKSRLKPEEIINRNFLDQYIKNNPIKS